MATRLTDTQFVILSSTSRRNDRGVDLPANVTGEALRKAIDKLIRAGIAGFKTCWRWKSRNRVGRPRIDQGLATKSRCKVTLTALQLPILDSAVISLRFGDSTSL